MTKTLRGAKAVFSRAIQSPVGRLARKAGGVSAMSIGGQITLVAAIPVLTRLYSPADFGLFTIYISSVNILGAIAALRYTSSLFVVENEAQAQVTFKLIVVVIIATSILTFAAGAVLATSGLVPQWQRRLVWLIPLGMAGAGLAEAVNSWSLRFDFLRDFAFGRLILPASMTVFLLAFGFAGFGGDAMILAHILSQIALIGFLASRMFTQRDLGGAWRAPLRAVIGRAIREYKFPMFDLPAALAGYAIINLPAILIGSFFGPTFAGHFGVATRLVTGPVTMIALPLSNIFVAETSNGARHADMLATARRLLVMTTCVIVAPVLALGFVAPYIVVPMLGEPWRLTGQIITALAVMAAIQSISTPIQETPTLVRRLEVRLLIDVVRTLLVFGPLVYGGYAGWDPMQAIYLMAIGGALGYALGAVTSLVLLSQSSATYNSQKPAASQSST